MGPHRASTHLETWERALAWTAILAGALVTLRASAALFGEPETPALAADPLAFVLWFDLVTGLAAMLSGAAELGQRRWAPGLAVALAATTTALFSVFAGHLVLGGVPEVGEAGVLALWMAFWVVAAAVFVETTVRRR